MNALGWLSVVAGAALVALALVDAALSILHPDVDGPATRRVQRGIWRALSAASRRLGRWQRGSLALAGPLMVTATVITWEGLLITGFALVAWPMLAEAYSVAPGLAPVTFWDALYYSGVTATTLGYGDITPLTRPLQALAVLEAGAGFALLTAVLTYLFNVLGGIAERNSLALQVFADTYGSGDSVRFVSRTLALAGPRGLATQVDAWVAGLRDLVVKLRRYPLLSFYYRSVDPADDPEPMFRAMAEAAVATHMVAEEAGDGLAASADRLCVMAAHFMAVVARHYMPEGVVERLESPRPGAEDAARVAAVRARLEGQLGRELPPLAGAGERAALDMTYRTRVFLGGLDGVTGWRELDQGRWRAVDGW